MTMFTFPVVDLLYVVVGVELYSVLSVSVPISTSLLSVKTGYVTSPLLLGASVGDADIVPPSDTDITCRGRYLSTKFFIPGFEEVECSSMTLFIHIDISLAVMRFAVSGGNVRTTWATRLPLLPQGKQMNNQADEELISLEYRLHITVHAITF